MFAFFDSLAIGAGVAGGGVGVGVGLAVEDLEDGLVSLPSSMGAPRDGQGDADADAYAGGGENVSGLGMSQAASAAALGAAGIDTDLDFFSFLTGGDELLLPCPSPQKAARPPDGGVGFDGGGGSTMSSGFDPQLAMSTADVDALALPHGPVSEPMLSLLLLRSRPRFLPPMKPCKPLTALDHEPPGDVGDAEPFPLLLPLPLPMPMPTSSLSSLNLSMSGVVARLLGLSLIVQGNLPVLRNASPPPPPPPTPPPPPPPLPLRLRWCWWAWWWIAMGDVGELGDGGTLSGLRLRAKNGSGPPRPGWNWNWDWEVGESGFGFGFGFGGMMIGVGGPFFSVVGDLGRPGSHWLNMLPIPGTGGGEVVIGEVVSDVAAVDMERWVASESQ